MPVLYSLVPEKITPHPIQTSHIFLIIGYFKFRKYYWSYGDTVVTSCSGKSDRDGAITDALLLTQ